MKADSTDIAAGIASDHAASVTACLNDRRNPAQDFWTCFGRWLEVCTYQAGGDITGVDLTVWAKWYGEHTDPADAVIYYRCATEGHEFAYEPGQDEDEAPRCTHCGKEDNGQV